MNSSLLHFFKKACQIVFVCSLIAIFYLAFTKQTNTFDIIYADKFKHAMAFSWLSFWGYFGWPHIWFKRILFLLLLGISIELVQYFIPYRAASIADLFANTLGIFSFEILRSIKIRYFSSYK